MTVSYSDVEGGQAQVYRESGYTWNWGSGNLDTDPLFADAANGDFHLKSAAGRWTGSGWVNDSETSLCIDAGDPQDDYSNEPSPNGGRVNMGAYGNTAQASKCDYLMNVWVDKFYSGSSDGTGQRPFKTISAGINAVRANGTVHVVNRDYYYERFTFNSSWSKSIIVKGENGQATLNGQAAGSVLVFLNVPAQITLDNIGVYNGRYDNGGGVYIYNSSPVFNDCNIVNNQAYSSDQYMPAQGGGIYVQGGHPVFSYCTINANNATHGLSNKYGEGGGLYVLNSSAEFKYCSFGPSYPWNTAEESNSEEMDLVNQTATPHFHQCTTRGNPGLSSTKCAWQYNYPMVD